MLRTLSRFGFVIILNSALIACSSSSPSSGDAVVVARNVDGTFDLVVGHSHHVAEATTDKGDAYQLIHAREGTIESFTESPAQRIEEIYAKDTYRHYGASGEPAMPMCQIDDQDPVEVDAPPDGLLNMNEPKDPVSCTTKHGVTLYVTSWEE